MKRGKLEKDKTTLVVCQSKMLFQNTKIWGKQQFIRKSTWGLMILYYSINMRKKIV